MDAIGRRVAATLLAALLIGSCAGDDDPVVTGPVTTTVPPALAPGAPPPLAGDDGAEQPAPGAATTVGPAGRPAGGGGGATSAPAAGDTTTTTGAAPAGDEPVRPPPPVDDAGPLGSMGPALLSPAIPGASLEIDATGGLELTTRAREGLVAALRTYGGKRTVTSAGASTVPASDTYSLEDLRRLAAAHRTTRSDSARVAVYVLVLEGEFEDAGVTGVAFEASSFAIFPDTLSGGVLSSTAYPRFEQSVAVHELGHLFGLVDLTGHGAFHEDPEHPGHSASRASVMYWAVEDVTIANLFRGGPPVDFDADDRREMDLIRSAG